MKEYSYYLETIGEYGQVTEVDYPLVTLNGLPNTFLHEILISETGEIGEVFTIERGTVKLLFFSKELVKVGTIFARTNEVVSIPVSDALLGTVVNPLGTIILGKPAVSPVLEKRELETEAKGMAERVRIKKPFVTGVSLVDLIVPLGKGQKELIVGDRKTGKTSFVLNTIKNQVQEGTVIVYAGIGRKRSSVKKAL